MILETGMTTKAKCSSSGRRTLEKIHRADFENVMLNQTGDRNLKRFITVAQEIGLKVPFVHMDCTDISSIWTPDEKQQPFMEYAKSTIELCGDNGVGTVIVHPSYAKLECCPPNAMGIDNMAQLVRTAEKAGTRIALENMDTTSFPHFETLLEKIDAPNFGFCFDSGHWNLHMPEKDLLGTYGARLMAVHIHDNLGAQGNPNPTWQDDLHLLAFDGVIDFDKVAKGIAQSSYDGPVMLESHRSTKFGDYVDLRPKYFLDAAHNRAMKLTKMIQQHRQCFLSGGSLGK